MDAESSHDSDQEIVHEMDHITPNGIIDVEKELQINLKNVLKKIKNGFCPTYLRSSILNKTDHHNLMINQTINQTMKFLTKEVLFSDSFGGFNIDNEESKLSKMKESLNKLSTNEMKSNELEQNISAINNGFNNTLNEKINELKNKYEEKQQIEINNILNSNEFKQQICGEMNKIKMEIDKNKHKLSQIFKGNILPNIITKLTYYQTHYPTLYNRYNFMIQLISDCLFYRIQNLNVCNLGPMYWGFVNFLRNHQFINDMDTNYFIVNKNNLEFNIDLIFKYNNNNSYCKFVWSNFSYFDDCNKYDFLDREYVLREIQNNSKNDTLFFGVTINKKKKQQYGYEWKIYDLKKLKQENINHFNKCIEKLYGIIFCTKQIKKLNGYLAKTYPLKKHNNNNNNNNNDDIAVINMISTNQNVSVDNINNSKRKRKRKQRNEYEYEYGYGRPNNRSPSRKRNRHNSHNHNHRYRI